MNPGRELDALISEKIMGLPVARNSRGGWSVGDPDYYDDCGMLILSNPLRGYSTDIAAAWGVLEEISKSNFMVSTRSFMNQPHQSQCLILKTAGENVWIEATGESMAYAICVAALKSINYPL